MKWLVTIKKHIWDIIGCIFLLALSICMVWAVEDINPSWTFTMVGVVVVYLIGIIANVVEKNKSPNKEEKSYRRKGK